MELYKHDVINQKGRFTVNIININYENIHAMQFNQACMYAELPD